MGAQADGSHRAMTGKVETGARECKVICWNDRKGEFSISRQVVNLVTCCNIICAMSQIY